MMGGQQALPLRKSPSHVAGWRTRRKRQAASVDHARVLDTMNKLRREMGMPEWRRP